MLRPPNHTLTYADCWSFRGRQSFWLTRHVSYRIGAVLALLAARLGFTPRFVTALSFVTGVGGALVVALNPGLSHLTGGILLLLTLHLAYGLDCADGVLARATRTNSRSGALLDKMSDLLGALIIPGILGIAAFGRQTTWADDFSHAFLIWWSMVPRQALTTVTWIKEGMTPEIDRKGAEDSREHTLFWMAKKFAGNLADDVVYRTGIAVSWAFGCYWDFVLCFQGYCCLLLIVYLVTSYREVAVAERKQN
jgi:phosphatidylglycerophosphate synthase